MYIIGTGKTDKSDGLLELLSSCSLFSELKISITFLKNIVINVSD